VGVAFAEAARDFDAFRRNTLARVHRASPQKRLVFPFSGSLSIGERRVGVLGFGARSVYEPAPAELSFLERVASEFAVTVDSFLMQQTIVRQRDRLRVLFDITNALVSKLSREDLFSAISEQLSKVIAHDFAALTLLEKERDELQVHELHFTSDAMLPNRSYIHPVGQSPCERGDCFREACRNG
jgi:transcriptional regulator with GAF, ATPase, and Fis domain